MSCPNLPLILSEEAKADIVGILQYTHEAWGKAQVSAYSSVIDKALLTICEHPHSGKKLSGVLKHHRAMKAGEHLIFYAAMDSSIHIARVLHSKMDIKTLSVQTYSNKLDTDRS